MAEPAPDRGRGSSGWVAALVVAMFVAPILVAWWFAYISPPNAGLGMLNRGSLLTPPLVVADEPALAPLAQIPLAPGEWAMVYFTGATCDDACERGRQQLEQVYTVLGHDKTRVRVATVAAAGEASSEPLLLVAPALAARLAAAAPAAVTAGTVLLDWRGRVVIFFGPEHTPGDIKKDLKRLLRASKIK